MIASHGVEVGAHALLGPRGTLTMRYGHKHTEDVHRALRSSSQADKFPWSPHVCPLSTIVSSFFPPTKRLPALFLCWGMHLCVYPAALYNECLIRPCMETYVAGRAPHQDVLDSTAPAGPGGGGCRITKKRIEFKTEFGMWGFVTADQQGWWMAAVHLQVVCSSSWGSVSPTHNRAYKE